MQPAMDGLSDSRFRRECKKLPDEEWLNCLIGRTLEQEPSGRGFLQKLADSADTIIPRSTYFDSISTKRRLNLLKDIGKAVGDQVDRLVPGGEDPFELVPGLDGYNIFAGDGHYIKSAVHDAPIDGKKFATGHFFALNLRSQRLVNLTLSDRNAETKRKREHDMRALRRIEGDGLRMNSVKGKKTLWVWDRAGISAADWIRWKQAYGVYFISRAKENMTLETGGILEYDPKDPLNAGVRAFTLAKVGSHYLRRVDYQDPETGSEFIFLSSLTEIEPGVIAALYKARWDIEKVFDETKNKLGEKRSWGKHDVTKETQAEAVALAHNLMLLSQGNIREMYGIEPKREAEKRLKRLKAAQDKSKSRDKMMSPLVESFYSRASQINVIFVRWLRNHLFRHTSVAEAIPSLRQFWCTF